MGEGGFVVVGPEGFTLSTGNATYGQALEQLKYHLSVNFPGKVRLPTRYSGSKMEGGTNYGELKLKFPKPDLMEPHGPFLPRDWGVRMAEDHAWYVYDDEGRPRGEGSTRVNALTDAYNQMEGMDRPEIIKGYRKALAAEARAKPKTELGSWKGGHFADETSPIVWVRHDTRTDLDGNQILRVEEIQSDMMAKVHAIGTRKPGELERARAAFEKVKKEQEEAFDSFNRLEQPLYDENTRLFGEWMKLPIDSPAAKHIDAQRQAGLAKLDKLRSSHRDLEEIRLEREAAEATFNKVRSSVPDTPFKMTWYEQAVKRIMRYAADEGFDAVVFPPSSWPSAYWGKEGKDRDFFRKLYDEKIPQAYRKWAKRLGGEVDIFVFDSADTRLAVGGIAEETEHKWMGVRITPEMRTAIKKGMPLHSSLIPGKDGVYAENPTQTLRDQLRLFVDLTRIHESIKALAKAMGINYPIEPRRRQRSGLGA